MGIEIGRDDKEGQILKNLSDSVTNNCDIKTQPPYQIDTDGCERKEEHEGEQRQDRVGGGRTEKDILSVRLARPCGGHECL